MNENNQTSAQQDLKYALQKVNSIATKKYVERFDNDTYLKIVDDVFKGDITLANKLTDQCLAACGHMGYAIDYFFIESQEAIVSQHIQSFI